MINALTIVKEISRSAGWPVPTTLDGTTDLLVLKTLQAVNYTGLMLGKFYRWRWLYKQGISRTMAEYTTGDADVTNGSTSVTSGNALTSWTTEHVGAVFKADAYSEDYRIVSVTPPGTMVLNQKFNGTTATDGAYTIAQDHYPLPADYDNELAIFQFVTPRNLTLLSPREMDERRVGPGSVSPLGGTSSMSTSDPTHATIRGLGDNDRYILELDPRPENAIQIVYNYYGLLEELSLDQHSWDFPTYLKPVIHDGALHYIRLNAQDDGRAQFSMQDFFQARQELAGVEPMDVKPQLSPDTGRRRTHRRTRRGLSRHDVDWGSAFDKGLV